MRQRIEYIDRLKGLAILLVIIGHLNIFCFNKPLLQIFEIICTFHMPLFMVLSGIVISKYPDWKKTVTRSFILLCPFLIVGIAYTYFLNRTVLEFFTLDFNFGYWYLQTLAIFTVFLFFFHLITHRILHLTSDSTQKNILADITLTVLVLMLLYIANRFIGGRYPGILGIKQDYLYWLWFMAGVFIRKYNLIQWLSSNGIVASISLITYILYFIYADTSNGAVPQSLLPLTACIVLFYLFKIRDAETSFIERQLAYIGRGTLDVYIFHYFILSGIDFKAYLGWLNANPFLCLAFFFILAFAISYFCIFVGQTLRKFQLMDEIVYGKFIYRLIQ